MLNAIRITNSESATTRTPTTTAERLTTSGWRSSFGFSGGGGSRRIRDTRTSPDPARLTVCLRVESGLAMRSDIKGSGFGKVSRHASKLDGARYLLGHPEQPVANLPRDGVRHPVLDRVPGREIICADPDQFHRPIGEAARLDLALVPNLDGMMPRVLAKPRK